MAISPQLLEQEMFRCYNFNNKPIKQKTGIKNMPTLRMKFKKDDHQVNVDTYISMLGSLSLIAKEVNYETNKSSDVELSVVAQKEGSFESIIEFACVAGPLLLETVPPLIGMIQIMIELYKLKHVSDQIDNSRTQELEDNKVQLYNNSGAGVLIVNQVTNNIYNNNQSVQDALASSFSKIDKDSSVNGLEIASEHDVVEFKKADFPNMSKRVVIEPKKSEEEIKAVTLVVVKPVLEKSSNKWSFYLNGTAINADIKDEDFLDSVERGRRSFTSGDRLMVELQIKNEFSEQYKIFIPKSYSVLKVKHHITADEAVQMDML